MTARSSRFPPIRARHPLGWMLGLVLAWSCLPVADQVLAQSTKPGTGGPVVAVNLSCRMDNARDFIKKVAGKFGRGFVAERNAVGTLTIDLKSVTEEGARAALAKGSRLQVERIGAFWVLIDPRQLPTMQARLASSTTIPLTKPVSLDFREAALPTVFFLAALQGQGKILIPKTASGKVTVLLKNAPVGEALRILAAANGYSVRYVKNVIEVFAPGEPPVLERMPPPPPPSASGAGTPGGGPPTQSFNVQRVTGTGNQREAQIRFQNKIYNLKKDQVLEGKFKVLDILADRIVVYSLETKTRQVIPIAPPR